MDVIYHPYTVWECYLEGMYRRCKKENEPMLVDKAISLLSSEIEFEKAGMMILDRWEKSPQHHLSNPAINSHAYIGQSACFIRHGVPERQTRIAWGLLCSYKRLLANRVAEKVIMRYVRESEEIHRDPRIKRLF